MQITAKDLRFHAKSALDAVKRGEQVEITFHGKPVALMVPPDKQTVKQVDEDKLPGFGMWADRTDLVSTQDYVQAIRKLRHKLGC